ncbi:MAG: hypothetical protein JW726_00490 [Anaerolineales bacterium]|nr:hypothetical protein [Anaerolineales bacterium]
MDLFNSPVVPCCAGAFILVALVGIVAFWRYLSYRETLALAERGLIRTEHTRRNGKDALRWGIVITALGIALCVGLFPLGSLLRVEVPLGFGPWMLVGLLPTFFGLALILIHIVTRGEKTPETPALQDSGDQEAKQ